MNNNVIRKIKSLQSALKLPDEQYRAMLSGFGASSCKDLGSADAQEFISILEKDAVAKGVWKVETRCIASLQPLPYAEYEGREYPYASAKQLRMIAGMWADVSRAKTRTDRAKALDSFVKNRFGVDAFVWIEQKHVSKLVEALEAMKKAKKKQKGETSAKGN